MANREREPQPNKHTGLRIGLAATTLGFLGAAGAVAIGRTVLDDLSRQRVSASEKQEGGIMPSEKAFNELVTETPFPALVASPTAEPTPTGIPPTNTPEQPSPTPIPPTETPKPIPTATLTPRPEPSPTSSPTATKEPSPTPKPENPLPRYGVFMGELLDDQTGAKKGMIVMASIPQTRGSDQILVYYIMDRDNRGFISYNAVPLNPQKVEGNSFEAVNPAITSGVNKGTPAGTYTVQGSFDASNNVLKGKIIKTRGSSTEVSGFKTSFAGTGKEKVTEAFKRIKLSTGKYGNVDWTSVNIDDVIRDFRIDLP